MLTVVSADFLATRLLKKRRVRVTTFMRLAVFEYSIHHISGVSATRIMIWASKCSERNIVLRYIRRFHDFRV